MSFLLYGVVILVALVVITAIFCLWVFKLPFDMTVGVLSGATGNPAILAFANRVAPTERPDLNGAMIFPSMTIVKILFAQITVASGWRIADRLFREDEAPLRTGEM